MSKKTSKKTTKPESAASQLPSGWDFNVFHTFFPADPASGFAWVQVIDGKPVMAWKRKQFRRELKRIAKDL